jgi:hypothetical protein
LTVEVHYSGIVTLNRCDFAYHAAEVRKLVPIEPRRPVPTWGSAYHAAAAVCWRWRAEVERSGHWQDGRALSRTMGLVAALEVCERDRLEDEEADRVARECAQAAAEACEWVGPEWRVGWLDGEPIVERTLRMPLGTLPDGEEAVLYGTVDLGLEWRHHKIYNGGDPRPGRRVVDHKSTASWPERVYEAAEQGPDGEVVGVDLRDDLQTRIYRQLLAANGWEADDAAHLIRRAHAGRPPPRLQRGGLSRAQTVEATVEQWRAAIAAGGWDEADYAVQLERARAIRWQAWAPCEHTEASLEGALRIARRAALEVQRLRGLAPEDVPRRPTPGRWRPKLQWSGLHPSTGADAFAEFGCAACDFREVCLAEERGEVERSELKQLADFGRWLAAERDDAAQVEPRPSRRSSARCCERPSTG